MILLRRMHVTTTSLLRDRYHHFSKLFQLCNFIVSTYFIYSIEVIVHWIFFVIYVLLYSIYYSFHSAHKSISVVSEWSPLDLFFFVHVPDKIWVQEVGTWTNRAITISIVSSPTTTWQKKDDGAGDPIKMFLEESLMQQRNEMMDNFA